MLEVEKVHILIRPLKDFQLCVCKGRIDLIRQKVKMNSELLI